jgi:hypothetical protein
VNEAPPASLEGRLHARLTADEAEVPVLVGLCGTGRTTVLRRLQDRLGPDRCQYVDVERSATTPERFVQALRGASPFSCPPVERKATPRGAFDEARAFFAGARGPAGEPATFLLDEVLEFRTFESFPGLRRALPELLATIAAAPNRFVLASRFPSRAARAVHAAAPPFVVTAADRLCEGEVARMMGSIDGGRTAPVLARLCQGRPALVRAVVETMGRTKGGPTDPVAAFAAALACDGLVAAHCRFCYELRLNRARGYGALKAILDILAAEEPLTLTQISRRLARTPGSTKDYLSWLEDVDLVAVDPRKRYRFRDSILRLWVRLHCRPCPPPAGEIASEVSAYAAGLGTGE